MSDHEKAAREAVAKALVSEPSPEKLASVICQHVGFAARASQDPKTAVVAAVRGAMTGVFLANQDVPAVAVAVLAALPNMSLMTREGPEALMSWVMEGIAGVVPSAPDLGHKIAAAIGERFMGADEAFTAICERVARG